ncbi:MAG: magnesium transporter [Verrucomicrobiota bacterium]
MLAGSDDDELIHPSPIRACRSRLPWILITLFAGFVASIVLKEFIDSLEQVILLAYFVPVVTAMGGSTGVQSSTLIVRSLALGTVDTDDLFKILGREVMTAAIMGLISAVIMAVWVKFIVATSGEPPPQYTPMFLAVTVGLALFAAMLFAAIYGAFIPIILERFKVDPAVASGPFVTASNDIAALVIYYGVTLGLIAAYY